VRRGKVLKGKQDKRRVKIEIENGLGDRRGEIKRLLEGGREERRTSGLKGNRRKETANRRQDKEKGTRNKGGSRGGGAQPGFLKKREPLF